MTDDEFKGFVKAKLENIEKTQSDMWERLNPLATEVTILKTKAGFIGFIFGGIASVVIAIASHLITKTIK